MELNFYHTSIKKKDLVVYSSLLLFGISLILASLWEPLKYLKYGMPVILIGALFIFKNQLTIHPNSITANKRIRYLTSLLVFYLIAFAINFVKGFHYGRYYAEVYFVLSPIIFTLLIAVLVPETDYSNCATLLFYLIAISFLTERFEPILQAITHPGQLLTAFLTSELESESNYSFQFGMFFLVFAWNNKKTLSLFSGFLLLLSFKRIAILAIVIIGLFYLIEKISKGRLQPSRNKALLFLFNALVVIILFSFFNGVFDDLILEMTGVSSNFLTLGRYDIYQDIFHHFGRVELLGFGLGSINTFLSNAGYQLVNLHSDVLKVFFELGPILYVGWILLFYKYVTNFLTAALCIYMNILFFTDNVFIYFDVLFVFYFLVLYSFQFDAK